MAKKGINIADEFTFTTRNGKSFMRKRHNAGNTHLQARNKCIKEAMKGRHFGSAEAVQSALAQASRSCR